MLQLRKLFNTQASLLDQVLHIFYHICSLFYNVWKYSYIFNQWFLCILIGWTVLPTQGFTRSNLGSASDKWEKIGRQNTESSQSQIPEETLNSAVQFWIFRNVRFLRIFEDIVNVVLCCFCFQFSEMSSFAQQVTTHKSTSLKGHSLVRVKVIYISG